MKFMNAVRKQIVRILLPAVLLQISVTPVYATENQAETEIIVDTDSTEDTENAEETMFPDGMIDVSNISALAIDSSGVSISAEAAILVDVETGITLFEKNADEQYAPASITKILTALVVLEHCSLDENVEYTADVFQSIPSDSSTAGINQGAVLTVEDSLYALLVASANEAAEALAIHTAGSQEAFAELMNEKASELGCENSHFVNPHGYTQDGHYVSARDMAKIMNAAILNPELITMMGTLSYTIISNTLTAGSLEVTTHVENINPSSQYYNEDCICGKTGYTRAAENTLVTMSERDGRQLICVILQDVQKAQAAQDNNILTSWAYNHTEKYDLADFLNLDYLLENGGRYEGEELADIKNLTLNPADSGFILCNGNVQALEASVQWKDQTTDFGTLCEVTLSCGGTVLTTYKVTYDTTDSAAQAYQEYLTPEPETESEIEIETETETETEIQEADGTGNEGISDDSSSSPIGSFIDMICSSRISTAIFAVLLVLALLAGAILGILIEVIISKLR